MPRPFITPLRELSTIIRSGYYHHREQPPERLAEPAEMGSTDLFHPMVTRNVANPSPATRASDRRALRAQRQSCPLYTDGRPNGARKANGHAEPGKLALHFRRAHLVQQFPPTAATAPPSPGTTGAGPGKCLPRCACSWALLSGSSSAAPGQGKICDTHFSRQRIAPHLKLPIR